MLWETAQLAVYIWLQLMGWGLVIYIYIYIYIWLELMGWGLLPEGNEGSQPSVPVASALPCKHLKTQEEEEVEG